MKCTHRLIMIIFAELKSILLSGKGQIVSPGMDMFSYPVLVENWKANIGVLLRSGHAQLNPYRARAGTGCTGGYCWTEAVLEVTDKFPEISEAWPLQGIPQSFSVTMLITSISKTKLNVALKLKKKNKKVNAPVSFFLKWSNQFYVQKFSGSGFQVAR